MKRHKKRTRRVSTTQQFCTIAKDSDCLESIQQAALHRKLRAFTKGHAKLRLYFDCSKKTWNRFQPQIQLYTLDDSPVDCPSWLSKRLRINLKAAAMNSFFLRRAMKASEILGAANAASKVNDEGSQKAAQTESLTDIAYSQSVSSTRKRTMRSRVSSLLHKVRDIPNLFKFNKSRRLIHS
jgi:hypothetical protein